MSPTWSADSRSIAYAEYTAGVGEGGGGPRLRISTVALDGSEPTTIYQSACCVQVSSGPAWSPDGEWILLGAMVGDDPAASGIVLLRPDGSDVRRRSGPAWEPVWQPIPND